MMFVSTLVAHPKPNPSRCSEYDHVTILMATYNGERFIQEQLDSIAGQTHTNWSLIISDDGSTDRTFDIVSAFRREQSQHRITILRGPQKGFAQNFLSLLRASGASSYVAFADQDDVWFPDKLARAVQQLERQDGPAIYGSRTCITDIALRVSFESIEFSRPKTFENALVQNVAGGNTMVINRHALNILQPASLTATSIVSHDWWCYQMVTGGGGRFLYDVRPTLLYRQHGRNLIGKNTGVIASLKRVSRIVDGQFSNWIDCQIEALSSAQKWLTPEANARVRRLREMRKLSLLERLVSFKTSGIRRQTRRGNLALWATVLFNKL